jgi:hypothetical protein
VSRAPIVGAAEFTMRFRTQDRRQRLHDTPETSPTQVIRMILGTYWEMPGLSLHLNQAVRLFGLPASTCQVVLDNLVREGKLQRLGDGQYAGR